jgi:acylphosphatase
VQRLYGALARARQLLPRLPDEDNSETPARLLRIRGLVQGVGYRNALHREATRLGLSGWVRNRSDGSVEALAPAPRRPSTAHRLGPPRATGRAGQRGELGGHPAPVEAGLPRGNAVAAHPTQTARKTGG